MGVLTFKVTGPFHTSSLGTMVLEPPGTKACKNGLLCTNVTLGDQTDVSFEN